MAFPQTSRSFSHASSSPIEDKNYERARILLSIPAPRTAVLPELEQPRRLHSYPVAWRTYKFVLLDTCCLTKTSTAAAITIHVSNTSHLLSQSRPHLPTQTMSNTTTKPTILFIPGAWHLPSCYSLVETPLSSLGYPTVTVSLPSNAHTPIPSFEPDIAAIRTALTPLVHAGKDVILVAHSYGSMPANEAIKGLARSERLRKGEKGGVAHYVFLSAFVTPVGTSLMDALHHADLPWFIVDEDKALVRPENPREIFYNDLDAETAAECVEQLVPFSYQCYFGKTGYAAYEDVESTFVFCTEDRAIPLQVQEGMVAGAEQQGAKFGRVVLEGSSHSPMISRPDEVAEVIRRIADGIGIAD
jgi:pimeloyl-ACP methyl ester carboxylesterase